LFHDNNSREAEAIPHYKRAIALELPRLVKAQALAWLASSLYKTGSPEEALATFKKAKRLASDPQLRLFLERLERRIIRSS
jgi:tetratricopeptide (TPR) repeat protein